MKQSTAVFQGSSGALTPTVTPCTASCSGLHLGLGHAHIDAETVSVLASLYPDFFHLSHLLTFMQGLPKLRDCTYSSSHKRTHKL